MSVQIANVIFDSEKRILKKGTLSRSLEPKVFNLLSTLLAANGQIVTRDQLIAQVWNNRIVGEGAINRTVSLLRSHFSSLTNENIIETVPTQGYRLIADVIELMEQQPQKKQFITANKKHATTSSYNVKKINLIASILIVVLAFTGYILKVNNLTNQSKLSLISGPLIALKGWEYKLSTTDDGQQVLFHHLDENNQQSVYLYDTNSHTKRSVLTNALAAINADGKHIVYSTNTENQCSIAVYYILTQQKQFLFPCDEPPTSLIWGRNDTFYFNKRFSKSHPYQVFSYNLNTSQLRQVTNPSDKNNTKGDYHFTYNRKNNHLAVIRYINENKSQILITKDDQQLAEYTLDLPIKDLVWHPNKKALVIADSNNLYVLTTLSAQPQLLKQLELNINSLAVISSKTGSSLLVSSTNMTTEIVKYDIENHRHNLWQQSARAELLPRMQADRQLLLSTRYKSHHWWQIKNETATLIDVDFPFNLGFVRYEISADGERVLFTKHGVIYELNIDNGTYSQVFSEPQSSYVANYDTRNKADVIYSNNHSGQWQLWLYQRATNQHSQLTYFGGYNGRIIGQHLYYSKFTVDGLWRKKLTESTEELIIKDFNRINWLNWQIINSQLYFYREASGIWQFDIETGS